MGFDRVKRREALAAIGMAATAGCVGNLPGPSTDEIVFGTVRVANATSEPTEIIVLVERDGDVLFEDTVRLDPMGYELLDEWPSEPARYTLSYAGDGQIEYFTLPDDATGVDGSCIDVHIEQNPEDVGVTFWGEGHNRSWGSC